MPDNSLFLKKQSTPPSLNDENSAEKLLSYVLTYISKPNHFYGSIYAEFIGSSPVQIKAITNLATFVTKPQENNVLLYTLNSAYFNHFLSHLGGKILKLGSDSIGCGILEVKFDDETNKRLFTIYFRRSASLTSFFQIDQFHGYL